MDITLIYPHQLFYEHPSVRKGRAVALIEDPLLFGTDPSSPMRIHRQRALLHRASMESYAEDLRGQGFEVIVQRHHLARQTSGHLSILWNKGYRSFYMADPVDHRLEQGIKKTIREFGGNLEQAETPMLLTPESVLNDHFHQGRKPLMAGFYAMQRKRMNVLLTPEGKPLGGQWSFDADNRKRLPKGICVPTEPQCNHNNQLGDTLRQLENEGLTLVGSADRFTYPINHSQAAAWLDQFLDERFYHFGDYEDAISSQHRVLWHGVLTPMLNIGLLTPRQVLERALEVAEARAIPLNSLEGFVRQIIGWREFIAAMYRQHSDRMRDTNFWNCDQKPIPSAFSTGTTGIAPIDDAIHHALDTGWCHHIERLMLIGNIMFLCSFHPDRVYQWFMEMFVDAYDWVMVPNVYGMSQFADGGLFTTKPYLSGSNYVRKMSNYAKGPWCEIWDGLFWSFVARHQQFFRGQHRLAMMARNLDRMAPDTLKSHQQRASQFLDELS